MPRRRLSLALDVSLVLLGALLGIATNYATSRAGELPLAFRLLQQWSLPLVGVSLLLIRLGIVPSVTSCLWQRGCVASDCRQTRASNGHRGRR